MKNLLHRIFTFPFIIIILLFAFFLPSLLKGKSPIPADTLVGLYHPWRDVSYENYNPEKFPVKNPLITDPILQTYPWKKLVIENIKSKQIPLWNPYNFSGQPLAANVQSSPFNVFNSLFFILPFNIAWTVFIILPVITLGLFLYLFLRSENIPRLAALFASTIFTMSGFMSSWLEWGTITYAMMWFPLLLFSINKITKKPSPLLFLILVFSTFQIIAAGHWQIALYFISFSVLFILFNFFIRKRKKVFLVFLGMFLGLLITAPQILPALEFLASTARDQDQSYFPGRKDWFFPAQHLIQVIAPDFFGNPAKGNYWGIWNYGEFVSYISISALTFAVLGIVKRSKESLFYLLILAFGILLALENPVSRLIYKILPFLSSLQPSRIISVISFTLIVLSAIGAKYYFSKETSKKQILLTASIMAIFLGVIVSALIFTRDQSPQNAIIPYYVALRNSMLPSGLILISIILFLLGFFLRRQKIMFALFLLIGLLEVFRLTYRFNSFSKESIIYPETEIINYVQSQEKPFRIISTSREIFPPNSNSFYNIEAVSGYDPLFLKDYAKLVSSWNGEKISESVSFNRIITPQNIESSLLNFLNVKYIASFENLKNENFELIRTEGKTKLFLNKSALPRAYFVESIEKVDSENEELEMLVSKNFDFQKKAVSREIEISVDGLQSEASVVEYNDQSLKILVKTNKPAPLIISNINYPGWKAEINGKQATLNKVNYMFQGMIIPQGESKITLKFQPASFNIGIYIALVALTASAYISFVLWKKRSQ